MSASNQFEKFPEMTVRFNNPRLKNYILTECKPQQKIPKSYGTDANSKKILFAETATKLILHECNVHAENLNVLLKVFNESNPKPFWPPYNSIIKEYASFISFLMENTLIERAQEEPNYSPDSLATAFLSCDALLQLTLQELLTSGHEDGEYLKIDSIIKQNLEKTFIENREKMIHAIKSEKNHVEIFRGVLWQSLSKDWSEAYYFIARQKISFSQNEVENINIILLNSLTSLSARVEKIYDELESVFF